MNVLVIDDDPGVRMLLVDILEMLNWKVEEAEDCVDGLSLIQKNNHYDLALVDWKTPRMSGLELVKAVRQDSIFSNLKLMMITGMNDMNDVKEALEAGANEFLMKPFVKEMVVDKLKILGFEVS